jgi:hypothetical protein
MEGGVGIVELFRITAREGQVQEVHCTTAMGRKEEMPLATGFQLQTPKPQMATPWSTIKIMALCPPYGT